MHRRKVSFDWFHMKHVVQGCVRHRHCFGHSVGLLIQFVEEAQLAVSQHINKVNYKRYFPPSLCNMGRLTNLVLMNIIQFHILFLYISYSIYMYIDFLHNSFVFYYICCIVGGAHVRRLSLPFLHCSFVHKTIKPLNLESTDCSHLSKGPICR